MEIIVRIHYSVEDTEFISDYHEVDVLVDGKVSGEYGDCYDSGLAKASGFVDAILFLHPDATVTREYVADSEI